MPNQTCTNCHFWDGDADGFGLCAITLAETEHNETCQEWAVRVALAEDDYRYCGFCTHAIATDSEMEYKCEKRGIGVRADFIACQLFAESGNED